MIQSINLSINLPGPVFVANTCIGGLAVFMVDVETRITGVIAPGLG